MIIRLRLETKACRLGTMLLPYLRYGKKLLILKRGGVHHEKIITFLELMKRKTFIFLTLEGEKEEITMKNLMETLHLTAPQAMDALKIPPTEQGRYAAQI